MNDRDEQLRQAVALFRYGLIADLAQLAPGGPGAWRRRSPRRWWRSRPNTPATPRAPRPQLLDPYRAYLRERVEANPRIRATRLLREIRQLGYLGCYSQLTVYLRDIRPAPDRGFEHRFEIAPGEQAQVDFAQFKTDFTEEPGRIRVVWLFSLVLGYCRWLTGQFVHGQHLASARSRLAEPARLRGLRYEGITLTYFLFFGPLVSNFTRPGALAKIV